MDSPHPADRATVGQVRALHGALICGGLGPGRFGNVASRHIRWGIPETYRGQPVDDVVVDMPRDVASRVLDHVNALPWLEIRRWNHGAVLTGDAEVLARFATAIGAISEDGSEVLHLDCGFAWKRIVHTAVAEGIRLKKIPSVAGAAA